MSHLLLQAEKHEVAELLETISAEVKEPVDTKKVQRQGVEVPVNREEYTLLPMEDVVNDSVPDNKPKEGLDLKITQDPHANGGDSPGSNISAPHINLKDCNGLACICVITEAIGGVSAICAAIWAFYYLLNYISTMYRSNY